MNKSLVTNDLLPVYQTTDTGEQVIEARELHGFLNVGTRFNDWIARQIEKYGFTQNEDYYSFLSKTTGNEDFSPVSGKSSGGRPAIDYILKLDMAKELAMVENNEQGRKARRYFIEVEKRFKQGDVPKVPLANMEHQKITKLLQMLAMSEMEHLFTPATDRAIRQQIAEMVTGKQSDPSQKDVALTDALGGKQELPPWEQPEDPHARYKGKWYTTKDIAKLASVTVHLISNLSSQHNLRTEQYTRLQSNRGENNTGLMWVEYNETGKNLLIKYAQERIADGYKPRTGQKWSGRGRKR